jgi:uncharacterized protein (UPF0303 family)
VSDTGLDLEQLQRQESLHLATELTAGLAHQIGARAQDIGNAAAHPIAIAVRLCGRTVFQVGLEGSTPLNDEWLMKKIRVVEVFHQSTLLVRAEHEARGRDFHAIHGGDPGFWSPAGGGVPIRNPSGTVVGAMAVSGLTQIEDHDLCREVLRAFE